jgi:hypothetical protein
MYYFKKNYFMKKSYLLLFCIFAFSSLKSQQNFPLPSDNPFWTESHASLWTCTYSSECGGYYCECTTPVYYKTDTVINGVTYNRLYSRGICHAIFAGGPPVGNCPFTFNYTNPESLFAIIRQDTLSKTVYLWDGVNDTLLYDFNNILVGQPYPSTYNNPLQSNLIVISEDSLLIGGEYAKKWNLATNFEGVISDSAFACIIDGIGSSFGIMANLVPPFENSDELLCFSKNDLVLYPDNTYNCDKTVKVEENIERQAFSIYPNPVNSKMTIVTDYIFKGTCVVKIYTTTGTEIIGQEISSTITNIDVSQLVDGFYIVQFVNGKSVQSKKFVKE